MPANDTITTIPTTKAEAVSNAMEQPLWDHIHTITIYQDFLAIAAAQTSQPDHQNVQEQAGILRNIIAEAQTLLDKANAILAVAG